MAGKGSRDCRVEQRCESSKLDKMLRKASAFAGLGKKACFKEGAQGECGS